MLVIGYPLLALVQILSSLLTVYMFILIAVAILSWVNPDPRSPVVRILRNLTEPAFAKLRPYVPVVSGLDLTALAALILVIFIRDGILPIFNRLGQSLLY